MLRKRLHAVLLAALLAVGVGAFWAAPASAAPPDGWAGPCYFTDVGYNYAGGWCDGNGPDWWYHAHVQCDTGSADGPEKWAGDRSKSIAYCPRGGRVLAKQLLETHHL
jgi:hypothetical protein